MGNQHAVAVVVGIDKGFEQVNRADTNDGGRQFDLQHRRIHMAEPFRLVPVAFKVHAADKGFVAAHNHHDQQVGDHHHVDQRQHHQHDHRFVERDDRNRGFVTNTGDQCLQCWLAAKSRFNQMHQLHDEMHHIHRLRCDQTQIKRQLQPAAGKNKSGQGAKRGGRYGLWV